MKFNNYVVLIVCFLFSLNADDLNNQIYLELGGHGIMYSLNYERMLSEDISVRIGASKFEFGISLKNCNLGLFEKEDYTFFVSPFMLNFITGKTKHHNEFGFGLDYIYRKDNSDGSSKEYFYPIVSAAYRYHYENGWVFRASFTPFYDIEEGIFPSFGLSLGKRF